MTGAQTTRAAAAPALPWSAEAGGVALRVLVTPKAGRAAIGAVEADGNGAARLRLYVTEAPEGGKANAALIRLLAKTWRLPKTALRVRQGTRSRRKTVFIAGAADDIAGRLDKAIGRERAP